MPAIKSLIFDLDGTLIDSRLDLAHSVNAVLNMLDRESLPVETVISFVGDGAEDLLRRSLQAAGHSLQEANELLPQTLKRFLEYYLDHCLDYTQPYPDAISMLEKFSGYKQAILTNKPMAHTVKILEGLGIKDRFEVIVPGDGPLGKKPDPTGLGYILSTLKAAPDEAVLIGDSLQDLKTAKAAGCPFIAFLSGLGDRKTLEAAGIDFAIQEWNEFPGVFAKMESKT